VSEQEDDREEDEEEDRPEHLVDQVVTDDDALLYELHSYDDHEEVAIIDEGEREPAPDGAATAGAAPAGNYVVVASSVEELDECIEILQELREKMVVLAKEKKRT
jgi:hypothetical protein